MYQKAILNQPWVWAAQWKGCSPYEGSTLPGIYFQWWNGANRSFCQTNEGTKEVNYGDWLIFYHGPTTTGPAPKVMRVLSDREFREQYTLLEELNESV